MSREETTVGAEKHGPSDELELVILLPDALRSIPLGGQWPRVVGRGEETDIRVDHPTVSRKHARIHGGATPSIEDLGSHNGTSLGGAPLTPGKLVPLAPHAVVAFGSVQAVVRTSPRSSRPKIATKGELETTLALVAPTDLSILITGETGVGKEMLAREVQARSRRKDAPFVRIDCAALTETLIESELFGHERGAFTGAVATRQGLLEAAHGGTAFLDEVGELSLAAQAKLLRAVELGEIARVGSTTSRKIDVRYISATNRDLRSMIKSGTFREDLYFRLDGITLAIPPLRQRRDELERLARLFLNEAAERLGRPSPDLSPRALSAMLAHEWRGNVRELKRVMERAAILSAGGDVDQEHLVGLFEPSPSSAETASERSGSLLDQARAEASRFEQGRILEALARSGGNQTKAAVLLGISRRTLVNRLGELGLKRTR